LQEFWITFSAGHYRRKDVTTRALRHVNATHT